MIFKQKWRDRDSKKKMSENDSVVNGVDKFTHLPNEIYDLTLKEIIQNNLGDDEYEIDISAGSGKGDNYIGVVYRIEVRSKKDENLKLNIIAKLPPQEPARREQFNIRPCFLRESQFYDDIYQIYEKFQQEKGIDIKTEGFHEIPYCYKSITEDPNEALYFEDLKVSGFEMFDRLKDLTKEHVFITMKAIAKMHAVFFAIKDQQPDLIAELRNMVDIFMQRRDDPNMAFWFDNLTKQARSSIENCDDVLIEKFDNLFKAPFFDLFSESISAEAAEPYAIVCHGDVSLLII